MPAGPPDRDHDRATAWPDRIGSSFLLLQKRCSHLFANSGLTSIVFCTWFFNAAHRSVLAAELVAICAKFALNLSISSFSSFSFFFIAPGLLFKLFFCILACPLATTTPPSPVSPSRPESASARESRFAASFLFGRRRFWTFEEDFSIFETKAECLIVRLSFLEFEKSPSEEGVGSSSWGRAARVDLARALVRFLPATGAYHSFSA